MRVPTALSDVESLLHNSWCEAIPSLFLGFQKSITFCVSLAAFHLFFFCDRLEHRGAEASRVRSGSSSSSTELVWKTQTQVCLWAVITTGLELSWVIICLWDVFLLRIPGCSSPVSNLSDWQQWWGTRRKRSDKPLGTKLKDSAFRWSQSR